ncbi:hypothetical protein [Pseudomonas sp. C9-3]|uniref:hypothetical protein n=1 Tax=Pseudomonas sp. C9-3 TaxID=3078264 RepID=UPI0028E1DD88|nr:hypothetical protein [Pseudomonas sp. C9-3]
MIAEFFDESEGVVIGIFSSPQPIEAVKYQGEILPDDPRYKAWWDALLVGTYKDDLPEPAP